MLPVFHFFEKDIPVYGLSWVCGIALAAVVAVLLYRRTKGDLFDLAGSAVFAVIGGMIGSKLLFLIVTLPTILRHRIPLMAVIQGGFVFYGGLIGGMAGLYIYLHIYKLPKLTFADIFAVVMPLGHAVGRVGCHLGGCCYGQPYDGPGCVVYTQTLGDTPLNTPLFPIQLLEAAALTVLFIVLFITYLKGAPAGTATRIYLIGYAVMRFVLEFFRGDAVRGIGLSLSTSQWISIGLILFVTGCLVINKKKKAHESNV